MLRFRVLVSVFCSYNIKVRQWLAKLWFRLDQNTTFFSFIIHITLEISKNCQSAQASLSTVVVLETSMLFLVHQTLLQWVLHNSLFNLYCDGVHEGVRVLYMSACGYLCVRRKRGRVRGYPVYADENWHAMLKHDIIQQFVAFACFPPM